ncbi:MAG TPA: hypothetical protein VD790_05400, partial [Thermoleophilaceae bacterium]|nr:hypothetical protein [Thermoleophilaceae bacterium]
RLASGSYPAMPYRMVGGTSLAETGLTAGQSLCYRVEAMNQWGTGALSPERCVTPTAPPPAPPAEKPTQPAPAPQPASPPEDPLLVDLSRANRTLRAARTGLFTFAFRATPGLSGRASFATARRVRLTRRARPRTAKLGSRRFRASSGGTARVRIRLSSRARALLKRSKRLRVRATVSAGGKRSTRTFVLRAPRK